MAGFGASNAELLVSATTLLIVEYVVRVSSGEIIDVNVIFILMNVTFSGLFARSSAAFH